LGASHPWAPSALAEQEMKVAPQETNPDLSETNPDSGLRTIGKPTSQEQDEQPLPPQLFDGEPSNISFKSSKSRLGQPTMSRSISHMFVPADQSYVSINGVAPETVKANFIKKVYALLVIDLAWTVVICVAFMKWEPLNNIVLQLPRAFNIVMLVMLIISICALTCKKNDYPWNMWIKAVFVTLMGMLVGVVCVAYAERGSGDAIWQALLVTSTEFVLLSAYVHITKKDFSWLGGYLFVSLWALIFMGILSWFLGSSILNFMVSVAGVLVFTGYILYDTSNIIHKYGPDDYIIAEVELYLDIINLFLYLLALFGGRSS